MTRARLLLTTNHENNLNTLNPKRSPVGLPRLVRPFAMNLQAMMDGMAAEWQKERAASQMTLGTLIDRLAELPPEMEVDAFDDPQSYRGYYCDIAFERVDSKRPAADLLAMCKRAMGEVYEGYKGGNYQMGRNTPVWIAPYGSCGQRIRAIRDDGTLELADDED